MGDKSLTDSCDFREVAPIMMDLPYPPICVAEKNHVYANLLSLDYCSCVSEMTAITQYINHENRLSCDRCPVAKTLLGIAMAEMIHLQKLGQLIFLLGGTIDFQAKNRDGKAQVWTAESIRQGENAKQMLAADIEGERAAINQYRMHIRVIKDRHITAVLERIIKDEEYHIMMLQAVGKEL